MKFYDTRLLYLESDTFGIELGARQLQIRDSMSCPLVAIFKNDVTMLSQ